MPRSLTSKRWLEMDPIANLVSQLLLVQQIEVLDDGGYNTESADDVLSDLARCGIELAALTRALHEWLIGGGFNPYQSTQAMYQIKRDAKARGWKG